MLLLDECLSNQLLDHDQVYQIFDEWEQFQRGGKIGDSSLRRMVTHFGDTYGIPAVDFNENHWMREIVLSLALRVAAHARGKLDVVMY